MNGGGSPLDRPTSGDVGREEAEERGGVRGVNGGRPGRRNDYEELKEILPLSVIGKLANWQIGKLIKEAEMKFGMKDQVGIVELQKLGKSKEGQAALEIIDRICLRDEIAYVPGNRFGQTEFRCGIQQAGKLIRSIIEMKIDWDDVEAREKEMERAKKERKQEYGV